MKTTQATERHSGRRNRWLYPAAAVIFGFGSILAVPSAEADDDNSNIT